MFVDREGELAFLEALWREDKPHLVVIYGRRRIGKTWLVKKFMKDKRGVYIYAVRQPIRIELERFAEAVGFLQPEKQEKLRAFLQQRSRGSYRKPFV
ncbi:MAG: ATP-binding protein, partial [Thermoproteus sp.]